ncbi:FAD-binding and (Fe-S)-binding domain-containing protein [Streptomyces sp. C]|uniref:FAD-binding and (Fe-S)-binding domain-containing protein n=1 Tax=Streptomyces sp. C TaxID=253839 RepID=UPI0001B557F4|nr:FAD-binding and (Fe-S)-binding domain-containing protein [Streptomyces sp. C]EFL17359.1 D-lactate dehydrogenase [Streptomyces sp. C]
MNDFTRHLQSRLPAARTDVRTRTAYTSDASIYRVMPTAVLEPRDEEQVAVAVGIATEHGVGITCRGGGTSIAGNSIGTGLILDFSRYMNRIDELDPEARTATVQPGVVLGTLRDRAAAHGLTVGPDPSTYSRCTIGGMIGNHACGAHSVAWGTTADITQEVDLLLADGRRIHAGHGSSGDADIDRRLKRLRDHHLAPLRTELGRFGRQVSGYGLGALLPEKGFHVARSLVGTEGTCGVLLGAKIALTPLPAARVLLVLGFPDVYAAADCGASLAKAGALTVEGLDAPLVEALRSRGGRAPGIDLLPRGEAWLYCEIEGTGEADAIANAERLARETGATSFVTADAEQTAAIWSIRRNGAGIATRMADGRQAWPGWEDSAVPPERLSGYLKDLHALMAEHERTGTITGHFGEGCLHVRVDWELGTEQGIAAYREFITAAGDLVVAHGGCASGEHGDGRARSELLARTYSPELMGAFAAFKEIWDPRNLLNPGIIVDPAPFDADIRPGPGRDRNELPLVQRFGADQGSLTNAVHRCTGVGSCRNDTGHMCPSYQVTRDEVHSTRGRARVLSEMLRGETITDGYRSTEVLEALDLCFSCKACKSDCSVNVDMAAYKSEFLSKHYEGRLRPRAHYTLGWLPVLARLASVAPRTLNRLTRRAPVAARLSALAGLESRRPLVALPSQTFRQWFHYRKPAPAPAPAPDAAAAEQGGAGTVVLWPDTFSNLLDPRGAQAATRVLEAMGYEVVLPDGPVCCGLTWHSTGQLGAARAVLGRSVGALREHLEAGRTVIGLEPSCTQTLREEAAELLPDSPVVRRLSRQVRTLAEVVAEHEGPWPFGTLDQDAVMQPHCHQEAGHGHGPEAEVLRRLGVTADVVSAGCCGMAGNFGYEPGHWDVSQGAAERELYPKLRAAGPDTAVVADGFSCRTQISQEGSRRPEHLAELLLRALPGNTPGKNSENGSGSCAS